MDELIIAKCGELVLKGLNRSNFEAALIKNIKRKLASVGSVKITAAQSTVYIEVLSGDIDKMLAEVQCVFGLTSVCRVAKTAKDIESICSLAVLQMEGTAAKTFKAETKRADKKFHMKSPEISAAVGERVLGAFEGISVDVINPDVVINVEVRDFGAYVYTKKLPGAGGMPSGTNGAATLLLSGGIDSPAAGYMIAKRGARLNAVHFHSYPYTSERAKDKVLELASILSKYAGEIDIYVVPFTEIQCEINDKCPHDESVIIMRRIMMRIAERIAQNTDSYALVTGESLGQVASQTIVSLSVTNEGLSLPVFRPLIGMDKEEIVTIARKIGTFETSILPYEDCCTLFVSKHPKTKPKLYDIKKSESLLQTDELIEKAVKETEKVTVG